MSGKNRLLRAVRSNRIAVALRTVRLEVKRQNVALLAGSFAYHALVSLLPLLFLLFVVTGALLDEPMAVFVVERTERYLTPGQSVLVADVVTDDQNRVRASLLSVGVLAWSALKVFRQLDAAFSAVYGTTVDTSVTDQVRDGAAALAAVAFAVLVFYGAEVAYDGVRGVPLVGYARALSVSLGASVAFFPLYRLFPDVEMGPLEAVPGAVLAGVGWTALQRLFTVYLSLTGEYRTYGVFGGFLLLALWLYLAGLLLLGGAVVNAVLGGRIGPSAEG
ncbi:YihY/virulence factor BrkB family protein [Halogeometricum sp. S1BR25-6]|uniref:YihY/virulence factor BrkB family protein n=1 Tax=Halogeometricum salsisoli TaxID=2950536 RepID=A0ABU2GC10_9EURY|nr:YihY/virulence factor BrkB family protein [Halogeometricum sp. S1BR25-6]MDS0298346.1 YihY/virulence factor BrkB family protein [Halogeometricum sp. S1BR25-6]